MPEDTAAAIAALAARGAAQREPLRFHFLAALARRSAGQQGALRQRLEQRLAAAVADLQQRLGPHQAGPPAPGPAGAPLPGPLATLLHGMAPATLPGAAATAAPPTELKAVQQFAGTWARLRVDQQLQRSVVRQPDNAGPLNSQRLMLQTLQALRSLSPAYLQRFMAHADALLWLEDRSAGPAAPAQPESPRKRRPARRGPA
ncbi:MAG: DUF2894 domain-containing protein [Pseudomonadota bacterium]